MPRVQSGLLLKYSSREFELILKFVVVWVTIDYDMNCLSLPEPVVKNAIKSNSMLASLYVLPLLFSYTFNNLLICISMLLYRYILFHKLSYSDKVRQGLYKIVCLS